MRTEKALRREEGHLRVICDRPFLAVGRGELLNSLVAELTPDLGPREEFDRRAKRITERTAEERPGEAVDSNVERKISRTANGLAT